MEAPTASQLQGFMAPLEVKLKLSSVELEESIVKLREDELTRAQVFPVAPALPFCLGIFAGGGHAHRALSWQDAAVVVVREELSRVVWCWRAETREREPVIPARLAIQALGDSYLL